MRPVHWPDPDLASFPWCLAAGTTTDDLDAVTCPHCADILRLLDELPSWYFRPDAPDITEPDRLAAARERTRVDADIARQVVEAMRHDSTRAARRILRACRPRLEFISLSLAAMAAPAAVVGERAPDPGGAT